MFNLLNEEYNGIYGVKEINSGKEGPIVGISVCTHGGEHAGLKAVKYLIEKLDIENNLIKGKLYFILTNIKAYKNSLINGNKNPVDFRFIDENLNRCCSFENLNKGNSYEIKRALELENILKKLDYHLDIHSTYTPSEAMLITSKKGGKISSIFNVDTIYSGLIDIQIGKPLIDITERNGGIGIGLEAGYEKDDTLFKIGVENSIRLLGKLGMIEKKKFNNEISNNKKNIHIKVYDSIIIEGKGFNPIKQFKHKEIIKKGDIIAIYKNKKYIAKKDSYILIPNINPIGEEYSFLGEVN